ncbi:MAG: 4-hydroxy-3-methylbut-2-en-1-yl diphosphate synthase [Bacteroidaceae bacterium]|nr:4-hydroxy-3-methylbut-2-en-1-yl diphosphate synthase [Bacteroidaceae bacterium]
MNFFNYQRRKSSEVQIGGTPLGADNPIRVQSMTTTATTDTEGSVAQARRIIEAGGEYVRLTTQGVREAENLREINIGLRSQGINTPLVADVHFNARVADVAALYAEKVRINPGNYVDTARTFKQLTYTDEEYAAEIAKIRARLVPFLSICKENHTAIRIGVNHGSLSDRIMSRYGDTPEGMVESCMEFLRICVDENFFNVVISIKASNTVIMVRTVRLLVKTMEQEGMNFPLHLGVTEAGEGEDGRIKSAVGIGALLYDGLGDTIRVSLSEAPEAEIPVAKALVQYVTAHAMHPHIEGVEAESFNYVAPMRRTTHAVANIGGNQVPVVIGSYFDEARTFDANLRPDYLYCGSTLPTERLDIPLIVDAPAWTGEKNTYPVFMGFGEKNYLPLLATCSAPIKFLFVTYSQCSEEVLACLKTHPEVVVIHQTNHPHRVGEHRALAHLLMHEGITNPIIYFQHYAEENLSELQLRAAADSGLLCIDGLIDGLYLHNIGNSIAPQAVDTTAFNILQAARVRTSKTEYISCPGCGRTLYALEDTIARIKAATAHLKGLKIAIMGCIVNGPGEMADADYGYVGAARGKVSLYRKKECIEKNIPEEQAVDKLLQLIETCENERLTCND